MTSTRAGIGAATLLVVAGCSLAPWTFVPRDGSVVEDSDASGPDASGPDASRADAGPIDAGPPRPPEVVSTSPSDSATGVEATAQITLEFSTEMDAASIDDTTVTLAGDAPVVGSVSTGGRIVTFRPAAPLAFGTAHTLRVAGSVRSTSGLELGADYELAFTTRGDRVFQPPTRLVPMGAMAGERPRAWISETGDATVVYAQSDELFAATSREGTFPRPALISGIEESRGDFAIDGNAIGDVAVAFHSIGEVFLVERMASAWTAPRLVASAARLDDENQRVGVGLDRAGVSYVAWGRESVLATHAVDGVIGAPSLIQREARRSEGCEVASEAAGIALAVWTEDTGRPWSAAYVAPSGWARAEELDPGATGGAASDLHVRADALGGFAAVWIGGSTAWLTRAGPGGAWSAPSAVGMVVPSATPAPSVALDLSASGRVAVVLRQGSSNPLLGWTGAPGAPLGGSRTIAADGGDEALVAADDHGGAVVVWRDGGQLYRSRLRPGTTAWTSPEGFATQASQFDLASNARGDAVIVWVQYETVGGDLVYASLLR